MVLRVALGPGLLASRLLVVAFAVLLSSPQGHAASLAAERRRVDSHWKSGLRFASIGLLRLQQSVITAGRGLLAWMPIPRLALEACVPSHAPRRRQKRPWFSPIVLPRMPQPTASTAVA